MDFLKLFLKKVIGTKLFLFTSYGVDDVKYGVREDRSLLPVLSYFPNYTAKPSFIR